MKWGKAILTFICIILFPAIIMNLLLGDESIGFIELLQFQLFAAIFGIPYIATTLIFSSDIENNKKMKWMWITAGLIIGLLIIAIILELTFMSDWGLAILSIIIMEGVYIFGIIITTSILSFLLRYEESKQTKIILILFVIFLMLDLLQLFGLFRPGLIE